MKTCFWSGALALLLSLGACAGKSADPGVATGGSASGGTATAGTASGGKASAGGGTASGGKASASAGTASGGKASASAGEANGGSPSAGDASVGGASAGAGDGLALGDPCLLDQEHMPSISGFQVSEINLETQSLSCASGICLANHFQGRVSCPYGQAAGGNDCTLPGSNAPVTGQVRPQLKERLASQVVTCTCHCAGTGPGPYCTCPESMECVELVSKILDDPEDLSGSYCILKGTTYDPAGQATPCDAAAMDCGDAHPY